jgi:hypothetical protein
MRRAGIIAATVFVSLLLIAVGIEYRGKHPHVPPGMESRDCLRPPPPNETGNDWLIRLGGRITRYPNAQWQGDSYTVADIAQGRDLTKYEKLELRDREHFHPWERWDNPSLAPARSFLWEHWRDRKRAYLVLTQSSVDHTGTSHMFVEPDGSGRWRVYRRQLDRRELVDEPTAYLVVWVIPNGWDRPGTPLPAGQAPDPMKDELEFRDVCGEQDGTL